MITLAWRCRRTNLGPQSRHEVDIKNSLKNDWMFVAIVNLKKVHCESKRWPSRKAFSHTSSFLTIAGSIDNNQASMIIIKLSRFWAQKFGWITPNVNINSWFGNLSYSSSTRALVELSQLDFTWAITKRKFGFNTSFQKPCKITLVDNTFRTKKPNNRRVRFLIIYICTPIHWKILASEWFKNIQLIKN